jgi:hypothetical protein
MKIIFCSVCAAAALAGLPLGSQAGIVTFAEFDGTADDAPLSSAPEGLPDGITATWTGFLLHTRAGDTPVSIFTSDDLAGRDDAVARFSAPVLISSINVFASTWGSPMSIVAKRWGVEIWRFSTAGNDTWQKVTTGAGKEIDTLIFEGRWNHFDDIEVEPALDSDGDGYTDADEIATGYDPQDPNDNPTAKAIADSKVQFTTTGIQGENDWYYGYRNVTKDGGGDTYDPTSGFIEFAPEAWTGGQWVFGGNPPWTLLGQIYVHPNAGSGDTHWPIRRWVANQLTAVTPLAVRWHTHHDNVACGGNGVTGALYRNGQLVEKAAIAAPDNVGVTHTYYLNVAPGDRIDLALSAKGTDGVESDGCDGSQNYFLVSPTIPADPHQPDGSVFIPVGSGDTDNDGLADTWEKIYFPNDLTKLSQAGDFDGDGLKDLGEYQRGSDPTKADTDGDGLSDLVETGTGIYVSKTDTGSNPAKADSDGDGLSDALEVNRTPATNPNKADTDADGFSDSAETSAGSDPVNAQDTPLTMVIANSQAEFSGVQGKDGWYNGYRVFDPAGAMDYNPNQDFIPYPGGEGQGDWDGVNQMWNNGTWALNTAGGAPWIFQNAIGLHPNGTNSAATIGGSADVTKELWPIRRWAATELPTNTPVTVIWQVRKTNLNNDGTTGLLFVNGKLVDSKALEGTDGIGEVRRYRVTLKNTDVVDLALSPVGANGRREDWSDASETWFWVDTRAVAAAITISGVTVAGSACTLKWNSQPGARYNVVVSSDLKSWNQLQTVDSGGTETTFTDNLATPQPTPRFYRVSQQ